MVRVRVPATTANLGPGFDVLGMALQLFNYVEMDVMARGLEIEILGEGKDSIPLSEKNIVYKIARQVFEKVGFEPGGLRIRLENNIPAARGLGSSAAALVGGAVAANALSGGELSQSELVDLATEIEGHPDNVVPAMIGGTTICAKTENHITYKKILTPGSLTSIVVIPHFQLSTRAAREILPSEVPIKDAVFNLGRVSLLLYAFQTGDMGILKEAMEDRLHQPYRLSLVPGMDKAFQGAVENGAAGVALSGAGPTLIAFCVNGQAEKAGQAMQKAFLEHGIESTMKVLKPQLEGAAIIEGSN